MAKNKYALGVEIAGEEARLALVESGDRGIRLIHTQTVGAGESMARAFRALPRRPAAVACSVPLANSAIRILNLPPTTQENLGRVVAIEAEAVLPLEADELALSHHVLGMTEQSRLEVLLAAAWQQAVQEALRRVNCLPWVSATATVTSVALLNALQQLRSGVRESACALLKVEAAGSELMILDRGRVLVAQALPAGCGAVERAAPAAQPAAVGAGREHAPVVGLATPEIPWATALAAQVRYALQAVSCERGLQVERLYLCGSGASHPGADWRLSESVDLPVSVLAPDEADPSGSTPYAVAYGCALQAAGAAAAPLPLTIARVVVAREVEQRRQSKISWGTLAGAMGLAGALVYGASVYNQHVALSEIESRLEELRSVRVEKPPLDPAALEATTAALNQAVGTRVGAARVLSMLSRHLPEGTWISELVYSAETGCVVRGYSLEPNGAQRAQIALLKQRLFDEITLDYRTEEKIDTTPVWAFQLSGKFRAREQRRGSARDRGAGRQ